MNKGFFFPLEVLGCRLFQAAFKIGDYVVPYRLPEYIDGPGSIQRLPEFLREARLRGVTAVAGVELSTVWNDTELHLLGLFLDPAAFDRVTQLTEHYHRLKRQSVRVMVERLRHDGYEIDYAQLCQATPNGNLNRAHVAAALFEKNYVNSVKETFSTLLRTNGPYYTPPERLPIGDALAFLREIRAVPVLAHPLKDLSADALRRLLPQLKQAGLLGMEVQHSSYDRPTADLAAQLAADFDLLPGGGSDYHGTMKPGVQMGIGTGRVSVPKAYYDALLEAKQRL